MLQVLNISALLSLNLSVKKITVIKRQKIMLLSILLLFIQLTTLTAIIPYDGIIHRSSDGSSYAFLAPPRTGNHAVSIVEITPSGMLAVAWFTGGEGQPNCSIAV